MGGRKFLCVRAVSISSGRLIVPVYNGVWEGELPVVCSAGGHRVGEWMGIAGLKTGRLLVWFKQDFIQDKIKMH